MPQVRKILQNDFQMTRLAAIPLIVVMVVAIGTTKVPLLLHDGFWKMAHEVRPDYAMLL
jgi:putative oxidoreductase